MSVADESSFFSRFTVKFAEITAAGIATAVSGYLIAHVGGFFSTTLPAAVAPTSAPAAVQVAPGVTPAAAPAPVSAAAGERLPPDRDGHAASIPPERPVAIAAPAEPPRKPAADANAAAAPAKPRDVARDPPRDSAQDSDHDMASIEAKVRAALAKSDANRPLPAAAPPTPSADAATGPIAPAPRTAAIAPPPLRQISPQPAVQQPALQQPARVAPLQPAPPLATVDVPSRPIAGDTAPPDLSRQDAPVKQASNQTGDHNVIAGFFAAFKKFPDMLRNDQPVPDDQAPRPPLPVGQ
jgi:hypothetical protein